MVVVVALLPLASSILVVVVVHNDPLLLDEFECPSGLHRPNGRLPLNKNKNILTEGNFALQKVVQDSC